MLAGVGGTVTLCAVLVDGIDMSLRLSACLLSRACTATPDGQLAPASEVGPSFDVTSALQADIVYFSIQPIEESIGLLGSHGTFGTQTPENPVESKAATLANSRE